MDMGSQNPVSRVGSMSSPPAGPGMSTALPPTSCACCQVLLPCKAVSVDSGHTSACQGAMSTSLMFQSLFRKMTFFS